MAATQNLIDEAYVAQSLAIGEFAPTMANAVQVFLDDSVASLEIALNRALWQRQFIETRSQASNDGTGYYYATGYPPTPLKWSPIVSIDLVTVNGVAQPQYDPGFLWGFLTQGTVVVTYTAGLQPVEQGPIVPVLLAKVIPFVQTLLMQEQGNNETNVNLANPVIPFIPPGVKQFSVEGTHVFYETIAERIKAALALGVQIGGLVSWTDAELAAPGLARFRRRVVL